MSKEREQQIWNEACHRYADSKMRNAFVAAARWADSHPAWISVKERLPEKDNEFEDYSKLVIVTNGKDFWKGMYNYGGEEWLTFDLWQIDDATHWMEIVPPRKEEASNED